MIDKISTVLTLMLLLLIFAPMTDCVIVQKNPDSEYLELKQKFTWLNNRVFSILEKAADKYDIDKVLICALIQQESGSYCGNDIKKMRKVISCAGAVGICQVMPFHAKDPKNLFNLEFNVDKGAWYLSKCLKKSRGNIREACRMYNAGLNSKRWKYRNWAYVNRIEQGYKSCYNI